LEQKNAPNILEQQSKTKTKIQKVRQRNKEATTIGPGVVVIATAPVPEYRGFDDLKISSHVSYNFDTLV
jgi:hypothetical protein